MTQKGSSAGCQRATAGMKTSFISHKCALIGRRTKVGCHSFRATGITEYLRNGGKLEIAQQMTNRWGRADRHLIPSAFRTLLSAARGPWSPSDEDGKSERRKPEDCRFWHRCNGSKRIDRRQISSSASEGGYFFHGFRRPTNQSLV